MSKQIIFTEAAPKPVGPYNQAVKTGNLVFLAGQIPIDPNTSKIEVDSVKEQTKQVLENIKAVLAEAGTSMDRIVKTTVFMQDLGDFGQMNEVYAEYFPSDTAPARSTIQVAALPLDSLVEIEVVAEV